MRHLLVQHRVFEQTQLMQPSLQYCGGRAVFLLLVSLLVVTSSRRKNVHSCDLVHLSSAVSMARRVTNVEYLDAVGVD